MTEKQFPKDKTNAYYKILALVFDPQLLRRRSDCKREMWYWDSGGFAAPTYFLLYSLRPA